MRAEEAARVSSVHRAIRRHTEGRYVTVIESAGPDDVILQRFARGSGIPAGPARRAHGWEIDRYTRGYVDWMPA